METGLCEEIGYWDFLFAWFFLVEKVMVV